MWNFVKADASSRSDVLDLLAITLWYRVCREPPQPLLFRRQAEQGDETFG